MVAFIIQYLYEVADFPSMHTQSIEKKVASILPLFRVSTHAHPTIGYHCATQDGVYEILFDNTYSRYTTITLTCRIVHVLMSVY